jgi:hypothetical protein
LIEIEVARDHRGNKNAEENENSENIHAVVFDNVQDTLCAVANETKYSPDRGNFPRLGLSSLP